MISEKLNEILNQFKFNNADFNTTLKNNTLNSTALKTTKRGYNLATLTQAFNKPIVNYNYEHIKNYK